MENKLEKIFHNISCYSGMAIIANFLIENYMSEIVMSNEIYF